MKFKEYQQLTKRTLPQLHSIYQTALSAGMGVAQDQRSIGALHFYIPEKTTKDNAGYPKIIPRVYVAIPEILNLIHMNLGIVSEINELMDAINKKDPINIAEELADQLWYSSNDLNINLKAGLIDLGTYDHFAKIEFGKGIEATDGGFNEENNVQFYKDRALMANIYNASKLADYNKRFMAYGKVPDRFNYINTMKYFLASINNLAIAHDIDLELAMANNIAKLQARFPDKFDAVAAVNRDLTKERTALEATDAPKSTPSEQAEQPQQPLE